MMFEPPRILNYLHYQKETWFATQRHFKGALDVNWEDETDATLKTCNSDMTLLAFIMQMFGIWDMSVKFCNTLPALLDPGSQGTWRSSFCAVSRASPCPFWEKLVGDPVVSPHASISNESITSQSLDISHSFRACVVELVGLFERFHE